MAPPNDDNTVHRHPIGPNAYDAIMAQLEMMNRRVMRTETRLVRLLASHGLTPEGFPVQQHQLDHAS